MCLDFDLTFDLAVVTLTYKSLSGLSEILYFLYSLRCRRLTLGRGIG